MIRRFITLSQNSPELTSILVRESLADSGRLEWLVQRHFQKRINSLDNLIRELIGSGAAKDIPSYIITQNMLLSSSLLFCLSPLIRHVHGVDLKDGHQAAVAADGLMKLLLTGMLTGDKQNESLEHAGRRPPELAAPKPAPDSKAVESPAKQGPADQKKPTRARRRSVTS